MRHALLALQFLTIIPVRVPGAVTGQDMARSAVWFPLVGALQGVLAVQAASLLITAFPPEIASVLVLVLLILSNAAFHLDGLADTFDGLAMKSTGDHQRDIERRLAVMKDSTTGVAGLVSVVLALLLKFELMKWFLVADHRLLFVMPVVSQWLMVPMMAYGRPARPDGLGRLFADHLNNGIVAGSTAVAALLLALLCYAVSDTYGIQSAGAFLAVILFAALLGLAWARLCVKKFNGITGDTTGAVGEFADIATLVILYGWMQWLRPSI